MFGPHATFARWIARSRGIARSNGPRSVLGRRQSQADAFLTHLEPVQRALEAYCRRSLWDGNDIADVLQAAVANAFRDFHEFQEGTNFRAWIFRYVSLEMLSRHRALARTRAAGLLTDLPAEEPMDDWVGELDVASAVLSSPERILDSCTDQLAEAIRQMPALERSVFLLRAIGEFQYRQIAEILTVPMGTVMGLLARGRSRLRTQVAEYARRQGLLRDQDGG
jgi:RNA polymerase sigma-70 factor, ECF subfamily